MGNKQVEVVAACLGAMLYASLGFYGASRVWSRLVYWCTTCVLGEEGEGEGETGG